MFSTIPDIFNEYRSSLRQQSQTEEPFSLFTHETKINRPLYDMWNSPTLISLDNTSFSESEDTSSSGSEPDPEEPRSKKRLNLAPSCFTNGCVCGHHIEFRDVIVDQRKRRNTRCPGVTIRPKAPFISIKLKE